MGVAEGRGLGQRPLLNGLLVRARGADENILVCPPTERSQIGLDLVGGERDEITYGIESSRAERTADALGISNIGH